MKLFIINSVLLVALCVLIGHVSGDSALNYQWSVNGVYTDRDQISHDASGQEKRALAVITFQPVSVSLLPGRTTFFEQKWNEKVRRRELWNIIQDQTSTDNRVKIDVYNLTNSVSPDFDVNAAVAALTPADLHADPSCTATFTELPEGTFTGSKIDCRDSANGVHPAFNGLATCNTIILNIPISASETTTTIPYTFTRDGSRFAVQDVPDGYQFPC